MRCHAHATTPSPLDPAVLAEFCVVCDFAMSSITCSVIEFHSINKNALGVVCVTEYQSTSIMIVGQRNLRVPHHLSVKISQK